jgi:hypothetical protein
MMVRMIATTDPQHNEDSKLQLVPDSHIHEVLNFSEVMVNVNKIKKLNWIQMDLQLKIFSLGVRI